MLRRKIQDTLLQWKKTPGHKPLVPMITDAKSFGEALRKRRKELGYTQAFLSEFSGFSVSFISDL